MWTRMYKHLHSNCNVKPQFGNHVQKQNTFDIKKYNTNSNIYLNYINGVQRP
jgi:hypothetical protein